MNMYEDYNKYIEEKKPFLNLIEQKATNIYVLFEDILVVLDYIVHEYLHHGHTDEELNDFFEAGYGYLNSVLNEIEIMYKDYFKENIELMNSYSNLIIYFFYADDLKCHLDASENLTDNKKKVLDSIQAEIENILIKNLPVEDGLVEGYEVKLDKLITQKDNFHPVYSIFSMIREELNIY